MVKKYFHETFTEKLGAPKLPSQNQPYPDVKSNHARRAIVDARRLEKSKAIQLYRESETIQ